MESTIALRPVIDSDLPIFFEQQNNPAANEMAAFPARERDAFIAHWKKNLANDANIHMTILHNDEVAGYIISFDVEGHREVGYWLGRDFWGKRIASRALEQFLHIESIRPLYGYAAKHNIASQRVLEKYGFERVGEEDMFLIFIKR